MPPTFFFLNREDYPLDPLNSEAGQKFVDGTIAAIGGADLLILDNVQALLSGDMKEEEPWQQTLPWIRDLTRRGIGQIWAPDMTRAAVTVPRPASGNSIRWALWRPLSVRKPISPSA
jgi:hypothetical protein